LEIQQRANKAAGEQAIANQKFAMERSYGILDAAMQAFEATLNATDDAQKVKDNALA